MEYRFRYAKNDFDDAKMIREKVFVEEQGFTMEFDDIDDYAYHLVIYQDSKPIAVGRMYPKNDQVMILGRIASLKEYRGQGIGSKVVQALEKRGKELGYLETELSAQQRAQEFYEKLGYRVYGDEYYDEWCLHVMMKKIL